jgi:hypothetical protein
MPRYGFVNSLPLLHATREDLAKSPDLRLSVCAMGPVPPGDEIISMRVWIIQEAGDNVAASAGEGGIHLGGHDEVEAEQLPFTEKDGWMIQTELEKNSSQFVEGAPALGTAMALVRQGKDGPVDIEYWSQAVVIRAHEHPHG